MRLAGPSEPQMTQEPNKRKRHPALDLRVPFFRPVWRRVVTVAVIAVWALIEVIYGNPWWALLAGGIGTYAGYVFFFDFENDGAGPHDS